MLQDPTDINSDITNNFIKVLIWTKIYRREHKDQNDLKKKSICEITFYFKASENILSKKDKDIKVNYIIPKYKAQ